MKKERHNKILSIKRFNLFDILLNISRDSSWKIECREINESNFNWRNASINFVSIFPYRKNPAILAIFITELKIEIEVYLNYY